MRPIFLGTESTSEAKKPSGESALMLNLTTIRPLEAWSAVSPRSQEGSVTYFLDVAPSLDLVPILGLTQRLTSRSWTEQGT